MEACPDCSAAEGAYQRLFVGTQTQTPPVRTRRAPSHVPAPLPTRLWDLNTVDLAVACAASAAATVAAFAAVAWARVTATLRRLLPWATESRVVEGRAG